MSLPEPDDRLNSWKEIAAYLGRTVRTVQRWEKSEGLPLRRGGPSQRGAVVASKREIREWWEARRAGLDRDPASPLSSGEVRTPGPVGTGPDADGKRIRETSDELPPVTPNAPSGWRVGLSIALVAIVIALVTGNPIPLRVGPATDDPARLGRLLAASTSEGRTESYIPLDARPSTLVLAQPNGLAYVALYDERAVAVVDLETRRVVDRLEAIERPTKIALSPDGARLVVTGASELGVLDLRRRTLERFATGLGTVRDIHFARNGRHVWLTLAQAGLKILDLDTGGLETVPTIGCPMYLASAPRSRRLFVSYQCGGPFGRPGHDAIEIIDEFKRQPIIARAGLALVGSRIAVSPDEQQLWTDAADACETPDYDQIGCPPGSGPVLHVLNAKTLDLLLTVRVPAERTGVTPLFFPDATRLVLVGANLRVIDRALGIVHESDSRDSGIGAFTADGRRFIMVDMENRRLVEFEISAPPDARVFRDVLTHWSGDGTANDVVGGTHALTTGGVRFEPGQYGRAFSFDGASEGVSFGRRMEPSIAELVATYAAWIKTRRTGVPLHIASRTTAGGWNWSVDKDGRLAFCLNYAAPDLSCEAGGLKGLTTLQPDRWYHVAVVRDASALTFFVNGREDGSKRIPDGFVPRAVEWSTAVLRLGAGPDGSAPFEGLIDEVVLFARALSGRDLAAVMQATRLGAR